MFSGIIETTGVVNRIEFIRDCLKINITPKKMFLDIRSGDSVSVNGVCLTITRCTDDDFDATVVPETKRRTNLGQISIGDRVNLERSLKIGDRISGHYVQGHIDSVGEILDRHEDGKDAVILKISIPHSLEKYIVKKGYIALDGMSLTVIDVADAWFTVTLIPYTQEASIAGYYDVGKKVNIEVDMLSKYVEKLFKGP